MASKSDFRVKNQPQEGVCLQASDGFLPETLDSAGRLFLLKDNNGFPSLKPLRGSFQ